MLANNFNNIRRSIKIFQNGTIIRCLYGIQQWAGAHLPIYQNGFSSIRVCSRLCLNPPERTIHRCCSFFIYIIFVFRVCVCSRAYKIRIDQHFHPVLMIRNAQLYINQHQRIVAIDERFSWDFDALSISDII